MTFSLLFPKENSYLKNELQTTASKHTLKKLGEATIRLRGKTFPIGGGRDGDDVYTTPRSFRGITSQPLVMSINKCRGEVTTTH